MDIALIVLLCIWIVVEIYRSVVLFRKNKALENELAHYKENK